MKKLSSLFDYFKFQNHYSPLRFETNIPATLSKVSILKYASQRIERSPESGVGAAVLGEGVLALARLYAVVKVVEGVHVRVTGDGALRCARRVVAFPHCAAAATVAPKTSLFIILHEELVFIVPRCDTLRFFSTFLSIVGLEALT